MIESCELSNMKEHKFRAWDAELGKMGYFVLEDGFDESWLHGTVLMQYTGVKDRTGREIYEGDLLEWRIPYNRPDRTGDMISRHVVKWGNHSEPIDNEELEYVGFNIDWSDQSSTVVGNIYENPELLKEVI